jgi:hypothetical protein
VTRWLILLLLAGTTVTGCKGQTPAGDPDAQASPQALATPAPLSSVASPATSALVTTADGGPAPVPMRFDQALPGDSIGPKELVGYTLDAVIRPIDPPPVPKSPEIAQTALDALRKKTEPRLTLDVAASPLGGGRLRAVLVSPGFVLPTGTEIRARSDRFGQLLVSPDGTNYRVLAPGVLRALIGERRLDVSPMSGAEVAPRGEGQRLGFKTRKVDLTTRAGKGSFELAKLADAGESGMVLSRLLGSLLDAPPATTIAADGEVPIRLELVWTSEKGGHGGILFEVTTITRRTDMAPRDLAVPPWQASFIDSSLPSHASEMLASQADIAAIHNGPTTSESRGSLVFTNATDELRYAYLDGAPVAWLTPHARVELPNLVKGKYQLVWRSFLGDSVEPMRIVEVPGANDASGADAGP